MEALFKLRVLANLVGDAVRMWREDVWPHDPDTPYCCSGNPLECGCGGATRRDIYSPRQRERAAR